LLLVLTLFFSSIVTLPHPVRLRLRCRRYCAHAVSWDKRPTSVPYGTESASWRGTGLEEGVLVENSSLRGRFPEVQGFMPSQRIQYGCAVIQAGDIFPVFSAHL
jgi:hypothetical protein